MLIRRVIAGPRWRGRAALLLVASICAACAGEGEPRHAAAQGWVGATIVHIREPLAAPLASQDDCRARPASVDGAYAEVSFWWHGFLRRRVARLPLGSESWRDGDFVVVNVQDCDAALALR